MLEALNALLGSVTPIAVILIGGAFAVGLRGLPFSKPKESLRAMGNGKKSRASSLRSLMLALAGTLGVGNIVGVSSAIALGGAGAIFWMWVSALFAMLLKYAEVTLAMIHRDTLPDGTHRGGAPYYIRAVLLKTKLPRLAAVGASLFAILCLANSLMMGCVIQSNAVASAMKTAFRVPPLLSGGILAILCLTLLIRGRRGISAVTGILVPLMSAAFLILSLGILTLRRNAVLPALATILSDAFSPLATGGGIVGFLLSRGLRFGTVRGIISNEAGCGTSPTAHAASEVESPVEQGLFGILEVAVDTLLLCTVTALVVLIGHGNAPFSDDPMTETLRAYSAACGLPWVENALSVAILCFGFATLLCWAHYGAESLTFLLRNKKSAAQSDNAPLIFCLIFCLFAVIGAVSAPDLVWSLTDLVTAIMTLLNIAVLTAAFPTVKKATLDYFGTPPCRKKHFK